MTVAVVGGRRTTHQVNVGGVALGGTGAASWPPRGAQAFLGRPGEGLSAARQGMSSTKNDDHLVERKLDSQELFKGHFLHAFRDTVRLPDGAEATREYVVHPGAVVVIPMLDDGRLVLERQFRYPNSQVFIEFPAGKIDEGEDYLDCAKRELVEETGYTAREWHYLTTIHNAIAYSDEHLELYLAKGLVAGEARLDEGEFVECFTATLDEMLEWVRTGTITDVKTIIGTFWLDKLRRNDWKLD